MAWREIRLESADEIVARLNREAAGDGGGAVACRGQAAAGPGGRRHLVSTFDRLLEPGDDERAAITKEVSSLQLFQRRALNFLTQAERPLVDTMMGAMQLLRHYGGPMRLLDWSRSPWVAAYFACQPGRGPDGSESDGAIWIFDLDELVRRTPRESVAALGRMRKAGGPVEWAEAVTAARDTGVHVVYPDWENPRIIAQQGFFTLAGAFRARHDDLIAEAIGEERCRKLIIPARVKGDLMHTLAGMNLTAAALFPGADGIGRTIEEMLRHRLRMPLDNELRVMLEERGMEAREG